MKKSPLLNRFKLEKLDKSWQIREFHLVDVVDCERFIVSISDVCYDPMDVCLKHLAEKIVTKRGRNLDTVLEESKS